MILCYSNCACHSPLLLADTTTSWNLGMLDKPLSASFPYGILVVVAVGVALGVFLGGILLICASRYYRRYEIEIDIQQLKNLLIG